MAGRLDLKNHSDSDEDLGISSGYKSCPSNRISYCHNLGTMECIHCFGSARWILEGSQRLIQNAVQPPQRASG